MALASTLKPKPPPTTGASLRAVTSMLLVTVLVPAPTPSELAAVTAQVMVRVADMAVGASLVER